MQTRHILVSAMTAIALITASGCSVTRGQESTGNYVDDTAVTTRVKAKFADVLTEAPRLKELYDKAGGKAFAKVEGP